MKKIFSNFCAVMLISVFVMPFSANSQTASVNDEEVVFYGLDFTKATMAGTDIRAKGGEEIQKLYFEGWNDLLLSERDKYSVHKFFNKDMVRYDFENVRKRNRGMDVSNMVGDNVSEITEEDVKAVVAEFEDGEHSEGLGLVFVIESFDKFNEKGILWVTFFDIATKEVLSTKKRVGKPRGFGLKNYWAGSIFYIMEQWYVDAKNAEKKKKKKKKRRG